MRWSLSEFFGLLEIRSQCWCFVELGPNSGFNIRHNETILFYALLEGELEVSGVRGTAVVLNPGDIVMIPAGDSHAVRIQHESKTELFAFLNADSYVDYPPTYQIGVGKVTARVLCARLKVRWPFGQKPETMPPVLRIQSSDSIFISQGLEHIANGSGSAATLTKAAALLFTMAFRQSPECAALFQSTYKNDPISRAKEIIEKHPFNDWTVEILARKVGMGRSNFAAHFVSEAGKTPMEYVTEERMKHAARLLEQTDLKISAISERIGYKSEAAFSRRFTDYYGASPGKTRKLLRQKDQHRLQGDAVAPDR